MQQSEFFRNLSTATGRLAGGQIPQSFEGLGRESDRTALYAAAHLRDLGFLIEDSNHIRLYENPVVKAVVWFNSRLVSRTSAIDDAEMLSAAWEYFQRKTREKEEPRAIGEREAIAEYRRPSNLGG